MLPDFSRRSRKTERLDDLSLPHDRLADTLDRVEQINRFSGGMRASIKGVESLLEQRDVPAHPDTLSILDVGTGNGSFLREIAQWADWRGITVDGLGIDLIDAAVETARERTHRSNLDFQTLDLFEMEGERRFDIVHASLVLHHFPEDHATRALRCMARLSRHGVIVNDLHRHPLTYLGANILVRTFSSDPIVQNDGPLSVLRAFTRSELKQLAHDAGLRNFSVAWELPFRWLLISERP